MRRLASKIKHKKILMTNCIVLLFIGVNALTMKGFYNTLNFPWGTFGFINQNYAFQDGIPGETCSELNMGRGYTLSPENLDDYEKCGSKYQSILWTFISIDQGHWLGLHAGPLMFIVEIQPDEDRSKSILYTKYSQKFGFAYYITWYHGKRVGVSKLEQEWHYKLGEGIAKRRKENEGWEYLK